MEAPSETAEKQPAQVSAPSPPSKGDAPFAVLATWLHLLRRHHSLAALLKLLLVCLFFPQLLYKLSAATVCYYALLIPRRALELHRFPRLHSLLTLVFTATVLMLPTDSRLLDGYRMLVALAPLALLVLQGVQLMRWAVSASQLLSHALTSAFAPQLMAALLYMLALYVALETGACSPAQSWIVLAVGAAAASLSLLLFRDAGLDGAVLALECALCLCSSAPTGGSNGTDVASWLRAVVSALTLAATLFELHLAYHQQSFQPQQRQHQHRAAAADKRDDEEEPEQHAPRVDWAAVSNAAAVLLATHALTSLLFPLHYFSELGRNPLPLRGVEPAEASSKPLECMLLEGPHAYETVPVPRHSVAAHHTMPPLIALPTPWLPLLVMEPRSYGWARHAELAAALATWLLLRVAPAQQPPTAPVPVQEPAM